MRIADQWKDYELLDASGGERLERWGDVVLIRPDPQVLWTTPRSHPIWKRAHARYHRSNAGGGQWERLRTLPESWQIAYDDLRFQLKPMGFKHTGLFPEQAVNWDAMRAMIASRAPAADGAAAATSASGTVPQAIPPQAAGAQPVRVLNLFGYTGAATLACAAAGAQVTHVDAARGMVSWGHDNARLSGLADRPIRWLVDDCGKFVQREQRRGSRYDAILMDPPSYGRGPGGEVWKLEEQLYGLVEQCAALLSDKPLFFLVNSYTAGVSPSVMSYILGALLTPRFGGEVAADEIGLPVTTTGLALPCGSTALWRRR